MQLNFKKIDKEESEALAEWLSSDSWPYFLGNTPTKAEVIKRIEEGMPMQPTAAPART